MSRTYVSCYSKPLSEYAIPLEDEKHFDYGRKEVVAWLTQLKRTFPSYANQFHIKEETLMEEDKLKIKNWEVILEYEETEESDVFDIIENLPYEWDKESKMRLGREYFNYRMKLLCPEDFKKEIDPFEEAKKNSNEV